MLSQTSNISPSPDTTTMPYQSRSISSFTNLRASPAPAVTHTACHHHHHHHQRYEIITAVNYFQLLTSGNKWKTELLQFPMSWNQKTLHENNKDILPPDSIFKLESLKMCLRLGFTLDHKTFPRSLSLINREASKIKSNTHLEKSG